MSILKNKFNQFDKEEYLSLLKTLTDTQYESESEEEQINKRIVQPDQNKQIDLTKEKIAIIKDNLISCGNIKIDKFNVIIKKYNQTNKTVDLSIYEDKTKLFNNTPKVMPEKINFIKDSRFNSKEWVKYFKNVIIGGINIPVDTAAEIIQWLQTIIRFGTFI